MAKQICILKFCAALAIASNLTACLVSPSSAFNKKAINLGFKQSVLNTDQFDLAVFYSQSKRKSDYLHVYIEGDGQPFMRNHYVSPDPTSRQGLMLNLMALDPAPSVLIGRPCYHDVSTRNCQDSKWWTSHRYSREVVVSIAQAIEAINGSKKKLRLIGFSGGGAIALLLNTELKQNHELITLSANLDIQAWVNKHSYTPLFGSLNPIDYLSGLHNIKQTHLVGEQDQNIPYQSWQSEVAAFENATIKIYPGLSHNCCWEKTWHDFTEQLTPTNVR